MCALLLLLLPCTLGEFRRVENHQQPHAGKLHSAEALGIPYVSVAYNWSASSLPNFALSLDFQVP